MYNLTEMTDAELEKYTEKTIGNSEEYQTNKYIINILSKIKKIRNQIENIDKDLGEIEELLKDSDFSINDICRYFSDNIKKISLKTTQIFSEINNISSLIGIKDNTVNNSIISNIDIEFVNKDESIYIYIPELLPKKEYVKYNTITSRYNNSFKEYFMNPQNKINKEKITIEFTFNFKSNLIDYDNFEIKQIIDMITSYCLLDDNPQYMSLIMNYSVNNKKESTTIKIY